MLFRSDALVAQGQLTKAVSITTKRVPDGTEHQLRRVLYALPGEEWRIKALLLVQGLYDSLAQDGGPTLSASSAFCSATIARTLSDS